MALILPIFSRPDLLHDTAALMVDTWPHYYGAEGPGDAMADLRRRARYKGLPFGIVTVDSSGAVAGTATLDTRSHGSHMDEGPWLNGLAVRSANRRRGYGDAMVHWLENCARQKGAPGLFVTTATALSLFQRRGWAVLRRINDGHTVLRCDLTV